MKIIKEGNSGIEVGKKLLLGLLTDEELLKLKGGDDEFGICDPKMECGKIKFCANPSDAVKKCSPFACSGFEEE